MSTSSLKNKLKRKFGELRYNLKNAIGVGSAGISGLYEYLNPAGTFYESDYLPSPMINLDKNILNALASPSLFGLAGYLAGVNYSSSKSKIKKYAGYVIHFASLAASWLFPSVKVINYFDFAGKVFSTYTKRTYTNQEIIAFIDLASQLGMLYYSFRKGRKAKIKGSKKNPENLKSLIDDKNADKKIMSEAKELNNTKNKDLEEADKEYNEIEEGVDEEDLKKIDSEYNEIEEDLEDIDNEYSGIKEFFNTYLSDHNIVIDKEYNEIEEGVDEEDIEEIASEYNEIEEEVKEIGDELFEDKNKINEALNVLGKEEYMDVDKEFNKLKEEINNENLKTFEDDQPPQDYVNLIDNLFEEFKNIHDKYKNNTLLLDKDLNLNQYIYPLEKLTQEFKEESDETFGDLLAESKFLDIYKNVDLDNIGFNSGSFKEMVRRIKKNSEDVDEFVKEYGSHPVEGELIVKFLQTALKDD